MSSRCLRRTSLLAILLGLSPLQGRPQAQASVSPTTDGQEQDSRILQLTLEDALRIALRNNFDLVIQRLATDVARYDALGSWGAFDPLLSMTGTAAEFESAPRNAFQGGIEGNQLALNSSLSLPLISGGSLDLSYDHSNLESTGNGVLFDVSTTDVLTAALTQPLLRGAWKRYATTEQRSAELNLKRSIEVERETRARMLLDVYNAYWDLVSAEEELRVREIAVELGQQQLTQDQRRLEVGAGTEVDVLQSETNVAQQEELRLTAFYALRQARDTFRRLLAPRPEGEYEEYLSAWDWPIEPLTGLSEIEDPQHLNWRTSLRQAIEFRPELAQRRVDIESAEVDIERARSNRLPQLDVQLSSSAEGVNADPSESIDSALSWDFPTSSAALVFSMPLWNRTARNAERSAQASLRSSMLLYDRVELDVLAEVRTTVNEVDKQRESVAASAKSRALAQRQLEAEETRQQVGLSTTFQVLQFQQDLAEALSTEVAAKAAYAKALALLSFVEGRLGEGLTPAEGPLR